MPVQVYINVASMLPLSWTPLMGCMFTRVIYEVAGADGILALPLRTWKSWMLKAIPANAIHYFQGAWNRGTLAQAIERLHTGNTALPLPHDAVLFGTSYHIYKTTLAIWDHAPQMIPVVVSDSAVNVVELNPDLARPDHISPTSSVALDMEHLFRAARDGQPPIATLETWPRIVGSLRERGVVDSVHFKLNMPVANPRLLATQILQEARAPRVVIEVSPKAGFGDPLIMGLRMRRIVRWLRSQCQW